MSIEADRAVAERTLGDRCRVVRAGTGAPMWDEATGQHVLPGDQTVWEGPCSVSPLGTVGQSQTEGGEPSTSTGRVVRVPVTAPAMAPGDVVTVITAAASTDPTLVGARLLVRQVPTRSRAVLRRLTCTTRHAVEVDA